MFQLLQEKVYEWKVSCQIYFLSYFSQLTINTKIQKICHFCEANGKQLFLYSVSLKIKTRSNYCTKIVLFKERLPFGQNYF